MGDAGGTTASPRAGPKGLVDRYLGPEAGALDRLRVVLAAVGGALLGAFTVTAPWPHRLLLAVITAELCAGLMAALNHPGKTWIHRPGRRRLRLGGFVLLQSLPLAAFVWAFRDGDPGLFAGAAGLLAVGSLAVIVAPRDWQRATGFVALLAGMYALEQWYGLPAAAAWFLPLFYARTFLAHLPGPNPH